MTCVSESTSYTKNEEMGLPMRTTFICLACAVVAVTGSCASAPVANPALAPVLPSERLLYDDQTGYQDSVTMVVRDPATWGAVWRTANENQASVPPMPAVDFDSHMVLVVGAGRMRPGDQIRVDSLGLRGNAFVVVVRITEECQPFPADVYPLEIVKATRYNNEVLFDVRRIRGPQCSSPS
jgi:hypothetical protein